MVMDPDPTDSSVTSAPIPGSNTTTLTDAEPAETEKNATDVAGTGEEDVMVYPRGIKLALIMGSSYLSMFLVALVRTSSSLSPCRLHTLLFVIQASMRAPKPL